MKVNINDVYDISIINVLETGAPITASFSTSDDSVLSLVDNGDNTAVVTVIAEGTANASMNVQGATITMNVWQRLDDEEIAPLITWQTGNPSGAVGSSMVLGVASPNADTYQWQVQTARQLMKHLLHGMPSPAQLLN